MKNNDLKKLLDIVKNDPDSKQAKSAQAELNYLFTLMTVKQNKIITYFTVIVGIATLTQVVLAIITLINSTVPNTV